MTEPSEREGGADVVALSAVDRTMVALVGGKAAGLGELGRVAGIDVPPGFVVTTAAFRRFAAAAGRFARDAFEATPVPDAIARAIEEWSAGRIGQAHGGTWAVRSSATVEDAASASYAGQQDSYLDVPAGEVVAAVRRCWASVFNERAVAYRRRLGVDRVEVAVVVQRMVAPDAAGVMFTADPLSGHRKVTVVEAVHGLGDRLMSGLATPDRFRVRAGVVVGRGATLSDAQVVQLADWGRRIEAHFGAPQDIEWCRVGDDFAFVQSRPITTLFPIPAVADDAQHVYVSVGHQQQMTDALRPLGISFWQLTAGRPMFEAGGRLFVDVAQALAVPAARASLLEVFGRGDPMIHDAIAALVARGDFDTPGAPAPTAALPNRMPPLLEPDAALVATLIAEGERSLAAAAQALAGKTGAELCDAIGADLVELRRVLFDPRSSQAIMTAFQATWWLDDHVGPGALPDGLGRASDALGQSTPNNVTAEMGLELLRVADAIRPHAEVVALLERSAGDDRFLSRLADVTGGPAARAAIEAFLGRYGSRCVGEIDLTRPRWRERPATLLPILLGHVRAFAPGEAERRFARGLAEAAAAERRVLEDVARRAGDDQAAAVDEARKMIARVRTFIGYREHPKFAMVRRYDLYRQALLAEAGRLVAAGVIGAVDDVYFLTFAELCEVVRGGPRPFDAALVARRREAFAASAALSPPRVMTSDGEVITGIGQPSGPSGTGRGQPFGPSPDGTLVGLGVSAGVVEGRARVVFDLASAALEPGDILVTPFTDPSWTPAFVGIAGLVTEVGGLMTHGSVIARELGVPAVVLDQATRHVADGQRIRVHGSGGWVELIA